LAIVAMAVYRRPSGSLDSLDLDDFYRRTGMGPYQPPPKGLEFKEALGTGPVPLATSETHVGHYTIQSKRSQKGCQIKVFENLEGWKRNTLATWSGDRDICNDKIKRIAAVLRSINARQKGALGR